MTAAVDVAIDDELVAFHDELVAYLDDLDRSGTVDMAALTAEFEDDPFRFREHGSAFLRRLGADGWLGLDWDVADGGRGLSPVHQWVFLEVLAHRMLPSGGLSLTSIGPTVARLGSPEQRRRYLPPILAGELLVAVGYTEPDAGTDLASLRTRARRDGDRYVIDGSKVFTTAADRSTHLWLAARTGTQESRHRGISMFLFPIDTPGVTIRPLRTMGDERTNEVFLDGVVVDAADRVGEEDGGWASIVVQLNLERLFVHGELRRDLSRVVEWAEASGRLEADQQLRLALARVAADLEVARLFSLRSARILEQGLVPEAEASMTKVWYSELRQRLATTLLDALGPDAQLRGDAAPVGGRLEHLYRASTVLKFAGGTNELQRDLIAQRALGMPR